MEDSFGILKIIGAEYVSGYKLRLTFNNGEIHICDFEPLSHKGICTKLQDIKYFKDFRLDPFSVDWNNEIGFAHRTRCRVSPQLPVVCCPPETAHGHSKKYFLKFILSCHKKYITLRQF